MSAYFYKYSIKSLISVNNNRNLTKAYFSPNIPRLDSAYGMNYNPSANNQNKALYALFDNVTNVWTTLDAAYNNRFKTAAQTQGTTDFLLAIKSGTYCPIQDTGQAFSRYGSHDNLTVILKLKVPASGGKWGVGYVYFGQLQSGTLSDKSYKQWTKSLFTKYTSCSVSLGFMSSGCNPAYNIQGINVKNRLGDIKQYYGPLSAPKSALISTNTFKYNPLYSNRVYDSDQIINGPSNIKDATTLMDVEDANNAYTGTLSVDQAEIIDYSDAVEIKSGFATNFNELSGESEIQAYTSASKYIAETGNADMTKLMHGIIGAPYQFLPTTDCRIKDGVIASDSSRDTLGNAGYIYAEKITSRMPLLYITPCNTSFLSNPSDSEKSDLLAAVEMEDDTELGDFLDSYSGKLYTTAVACYEYFNYVNTMTRTGAVNLGIEGKILDDGDYRATLRNYSWFKYIGATEEYATSEYNTNSSSTSDEYTIDVTDAVNHAEEEAEEAGESLSDWVDNTLDILDDFVTRVTSWTDNINSYVQYRNIIPFYINSDSSFQETMTNETTESTLSSTVNGLSDKAREMQFLMGTASTAIHKSISSIDLDGTLSSVKANIDNIVSNISSTNNIFGTLANSVRTIVSGGRLIFPQIWSGSGFQKSYSITIKLTTPSFDTVSWYLNIYVPLCHLIALVLPRSEYTNSYTTPFILRAFYKGMFNIDMGIITDMSITKGKEGGWTKSGLPTVVEATFTIADLYSELGMTSAGSMCKGHTLQNVQELDYLANLCGIDWNIPDNTRMVKYYRMYKESKVTDLLPSLKNSIIEGLGNKWTSIYEKFWL